MNAEVSLQFWVILVTALLLLYLGIRLYRILIQRSNPKLFYSNAIISWLLISLFPVVLLFSVFQNSSLTGELTDTSFGTITVGGAFGAFFVLWIMGTWNTLKAINADYSEETTRKLNEQIANLEEQFELLKAKPKDTRVITETRKIEYEFMYRSKKRILGLITGDIQHVRGIDLWVNSENTNLQMARFYDPSISGLIRYLGAEKDIEGNVIDDIVANALMDCVNKAPTVGGLNGDAVKNNFPSVKPGLAFTTSSGKLEASHGVQRIIHVATVYGEMGQGYTSFKRLSVCVQNALEQADQYASRENKKKVSIVFPLFGTGSAQGELVSAAQSLFHAALRYFETKQNSKVDNVFFLVWKEYEKETCVKILDTIQVLTPKNPS